METKLVNVLVLKPNSGDFPNFVCPARFDPRTNKLQIEGDFIKSANGHVGDKVVLMVGSSFKWQGRLIFDPQIKSFCLEDVEFIMNDELSAKGKRVSLEIAAGLLLVGIIFHEVFSWLGFTRLSLPGTFAEVVGSFIFLRHIYRQYVVEK